MNISKGRLILTNIGVVPGGETLGKKTCREWVDKSTYKEESRYSNETRGRRCQSSFLSILACTSALKSTACRAPLTALSLSTALTSTPAFSSEGGCGIAVCPKRECGWGFKAHFNFSSRNFLKQGTLHLLHVPGINSYLGRGKFNGGLRIQGL